MSSVTDEKENLINELCMYLAPVVPDLQMAKSDLYMLLNKYEVTSRCTEVAVLQQDRNDYLLRQFLIAKQVKGCTKRTLEFYATENRKILRQIGKTVDDITAEDIRYYMALRLRRDKVSKVTVGNEIRCLGSFFGWLYAEEHIRKNPMNKIERIKKEKTQKKALTEMEIEQLRLAARGEREKMILEVLLSTGCRVSELAGMLISDIEDGKLIVHGKGEKDRYVYLNARAELTISVYLRKRKDANPYLLPKGLPAKDMKEMGKCHEWWKNPENVAEGHCSTSTIEMTTRKIAKRAGVEQANPHKFRRTCATLALRRGMPIEQVSKMLGHEQISTTQIYLELTEDDLELAHKKYVT